MKILNFLPVLAVLAVIFPVSSPADECTGVPDLDHSIVTQEYNGQATLLVVPDGSGPPLTEARTPTGEIVDATIHLTMVDYCNGENPVLGFPREDMWLESIGDGVVFCVGGSIADENTDAAGHTQWSGPLAGGGFDEGNCRVVINGMWAGNLAGLTINFNSPDINGDRMVNLIDVSIFTQGYYEEYEFRFDFLRDGAVNLSDISVLASAYGKTCD